MTATLTHRSLPRVTAFAAILSENLWVFFSTGKRKRSRRLRSGSQEGAAVGLPVGPTEAASQCCPCLQVYCHEGGRYPSNQLTVGLTVRFLTYSKYSFSKEPSCNRPAMCIAYCTKQDILNWRQLCTERKFLLWSVVLVLSLATVCYLSVSEVRNNISVFKNLGCTNVS